MLSLFLSASNLSIANVSPNMSKIDLGQSVAFNVAWSGGDLPFNAVLYSNSIAFDSNCNAGYVANSMTGVNSNSITLYDLPQSYGNLYFCAEVIDNNGIKADQQSSPDHIKVYTDPSVVITSEKDNNNQTFYNGESITFKAKVDGGIEPYSFIWSVPSGLNGSCGNSSECKLTANSLTNEQETIKVVATDRAKFSASNSMKINITVLSASIYPLNPVIDSAQNITFNATPAGGSGKYKYSWYNDSSCLGNILGDSNKDHYTTSLLSSNTSFCVKITDKKTNGSVIASSNTIVNQYPEVTLKDAYSILDSIQIGVLRAAVSGGTPPYTYTFSVYNSMTNEIIANALYYNTSTSNTFEWKLLASGLGPAYANVVISDSSYSKATANSINENMTIRTMPKVRISPISADINTSQNITFSDNITGGAGPFSSVTYSASQNGNATSNAVISGNNIIFRSAGTYDIVGSIVVDGLITEYSNNVIVKVGSWDNMSVVNVRLPANSVSDFSYAQSNATISVATSNSMTANVLIKNVTGSVTSDPGVAPASGSTISKVVVLNISVSSGNDSSISGINVTVGYPSGYTSPAPYLLNGTSWAAITAFSVNTISHTLTFSISPDPVVGVFGFVPSPPQQGGGTVIYGSGGTGVSPGSYNPNTYVSLVKPTSNTTPSSNSITANQSKSSNSTVQNSTSIAPNNTVATQNSTAIQNATGYNASPSNTSKASNSIAPAYYNGTASGIGKASPVQPRAAVGNTYLPAIEVAAVLIILAAVWYAYASKRRKTIQGS
ncbi:MAG: hypothetical protein ACYCO0_02530 [Candidatus Micrarchaeaceae archaeon]